GAVVADQSAREADQDRREGCRPRALRDLPTGRGRGAATDVRRNPVANRAVAGTARTCVTGGCDQMRQTTTVEVRLDHGKATSFGAARPTRPPFGSVTRLAASELPRGCQGRRIRSDRLGIWRMSA